MKRRQGSDGSALERGEKESENVETHESCVRAGELTRRDPLSAVSPRLQLKFQDSGITVTNWDRIR